MRLPDIRLESVRGCDVSMAQLAMDWLVIYCYPGAPRRRDPRSYAQDLAQHLAYSRQHRTFSGQLTRVVSLSSKPRRRQLGAAVDLKLEQRMLLDPSLLVADALGLPTYRVGRSRCYRRLTLVAWRGVIRHVFYPVACGERNPAQVLAWMSLCGCVPALDLG